MTTKPEGVVGIYSDKSELIAIIVKDEASRKSIVYMTQEAGVEEIEALIQNKV